MAQDDQKYIADMRQRKYGGQSKYSGQSRYSSAQSRSSTQSRNSTQSRISSNERQTKGILEVFHRVVILTWTAVISNLLLWLHLFLLLLFCVVF